MLPIVGWEGSPGWQAARVVLVVGVTITAIALWPSLSPVGRGAAETGYGVVGVTTGVGVGLAHLQWAGATPGTGVGLVCLASGAVLLGLGAVRLTRSLHGWWRLLAVPAALLLIVLVLYPVSLAIMVTNSPRVAIGPESPADLGLVHRNVTLTTSDGVELAAWYIPSMNRRAVVLLHGGGAASNRGTVLDQAEVLAGNGYGVLMVDARGHGSSSGDAMEWGWYGNLDVAAAVDFLATQADVDQGAIAAVGLSMGGEEAITAAAGDERIGAVVAEGATNRAYGDDDAVLPDHAGRVVNLAADWVKFTVTDILTGAEPPLSLRDAVAATAPRPILLITAGNRAVEATAADYFAAAAPATVSIWEVEGAGHTAGLTTAPAEWEQRVIDFLDEALAR
jgi:uncharacterized protein